MIWITRACAPIKATWRILGLPAHNQVDVVMHGRIYARNITRDSEIEVQAPHLSTNRRR
jgi:hypothetical protein